MAALTLACVTPNFAPQITVQSVRFNCTPTTMHPTAQVGLEQARNELPRLVNQAEAGATAVITRHGRPCAALVPVGHLQHTSSARGGLLRLRGTGAGLWGAEPARTVDALRREWD